MLKRFSLAMMALAATTMLAAVPAGAEEVVRGRTLLSPQEQTQHRMEMRNVQTSAERQALREKQQKKIEKRAGEQGVTLQHETDPQGLGQGQGQGRAQGQGRR